MGNCCVKQHGKDDNGSLEEQFYDVKEELSVVASEEGRSVYSAAHSHFPESRSNASEKQSSYHTQLNTPARESAEKQSIWEWLQGFSPFAPQHGHFNDSEPVVEPETMRQVSSGMLTGISFRKSLPN
eukprot:TRINITY_DN21695_c0_g1_i3.p2 TRINITY_DN21695_c0_g1~~TRINITY_DN21695_c0_g1_i3.p2  ORF type:complete len:127 (+),score=14.00 TRINITY_DN21695_c0_g1_i3:147-527(+)